MSKLLGKNEVLNGDCDIWLFWFVEMWKRRAFPTFLQTFFSSGCSLSGNREEGEKSRHTPF